MRKFLLALLMVVALAGVSFAAVAVYEGGTRVDLTENLNFVGGDVSTSQGVVSVATRVSSMGVDTALYATGLPAGGTNTAKYLCIYLDGTIYPSAAACR